MNAFEASEKLDETRTELEEIQSLFKKLCNTIEEKDILTDTLKLIIKMMHDMSQQIYMLKEQIHYQKTLLMTLGKAFKSANAFTNTYIEMQQKS